MHQQLVTKEHMVSVGLLQQTGKCGTHAHDAPATWSVVAGPNQVLKLTFKRFFSLYMCQLHSLFSY